MEWVRAQFNILTHHITEAEQWHTVDGIKHPTAPLGIHFNGRQTCDVTHLPSGRRIRGFPSLGAAISFTERVATIADWTPAVIALDPLTEARVHALAAEVLKS